MLPVFRLSLTNCLLRSKRRCLEMRWWENALKAVIIMQKKKIVGILELQYVVKTGFTSFFLSCFLCQIPGVSWTAWTTPPAPQMESSSDQMCRSLPLPVRGSLVPCARCRQRAPSHKQTGKHTGWLMLLNGALLHQVCNTVSRSNNRTAVCAACALSQCKVLAFFEPSWKSSNWWSHLSQTPND